MLSEHAISPLDWLALLVPHAYSRACAGCGRWAMMNGDIRCMEQSWLGWLRQPVRINFVELVGFLHGKPLCKDCWREAQRTRPGRRGNGKPIHRHMRFLNRQEVFRFRIAYSHEDDPGWDDIVRADENSP